jgi:hypothetical protein
MMVIADNTESDKQTQECRALVRFSPSRQAHPREGSDLIVVRDVAPKLTGVGVAYARHAPKTQNHD